MWSTIAPGSGSPGGSAEGLSKDSMLMVRFPLTQVGHAHEVFLELANPADVPVVAQIVTVAGGVESLVSSAPLPQGPWRAGGWGGCTAPGAAAAGGGTVSRTRAGGGAGGGGMAEVWWGEAVPEEPVFHLCNVNLGPIVLAPGAKAAMGPVCFLPDRPGVFLGHLFIRNNLTLLEAVTLEGEGGSGILAVFPFEGEGAPGGDRGGESARVSPGALRDTGGKGKGRGGGSGGGSSSTSSSSIGSDGDSNGSGDRVGEGEGARFDLDHRAWGRSSTSAAEPVERSWLVTNEGTLPLVIHSVGISSGDGGGWGDWGWGSLWQIEWNALGWSWSWEWLWGRAVAEQKMGAVGRWHHRQVRCASRGFQVHQCAKGWQPLTLEPGQATRIGVSYTARDCSRTTRALEVVSSAGTASIKLVASARGGPPALAACESARKAATVAAAAAATGHPGSEVTAPGAKTREGQEDQERWDRAWLLVRLIWYVAAGVGALPLVMWAVQHLMERRGWHPGRRLLTAGRGATVGRGRLVAVPTVGIGKAAAIVHRRCASIAIHAVKRLPTLVRDFGVCARNIGRVRAWKDRVRGLRKRMSGWACGSPVTARQPPASVLSRGGRNGCPSKQGAMAVAAGVAAGSSPAAAAAVAEVAKGSRHGRGGDRTRRAQRRVAAAAVGVGEAGAGARARTGDNKALVRGKWKSGAGQGSFPSLAADSGLGCERGTPATERGTSTAERGTPAAEGVGRCPGVKCSYPDDKGRSPPGPVTWVQARCSPGVAAPGDSSGHHHHHPSPEKMPGGGVGDVSSPTATPVPAPTTRRSCESRGKTLAPHSAGARKATREKAGAAVRNAAGRRGEGEARSTLKGHVGGGGGSPVAAGIPLPGGGSKVGASGGATGSALGTGSPMQGPPWQTCSPNTPRMKQGETAAAVLLCETSPLCLAEGQKKPEKRAINNAPPATAAATAAATAPAPALAPDQRFSSLQSSCPSVPSPSPQSLIPPSLPGVVNLHERQYHHHHHQQQQPQHRRWRSDVGPIVTAAGNRGCHSWGTVGHTLAKTEQQGIGAVALTRPQQTHQPRSHYQQVHHLPKAPPVTECRDGASPWSTVSTVDASPPTSPTPLNLHGPSSPRLLQQRQQHRRPTGINSLMGHAADPVTCGTTRFLGVPTAHAPAILSPGQTQVQTKSWPRPQPQQQVYGRSALPTAVTVGSPRRWETTAVAAAAGVPEQGGLVPQSTPPLGAIGSNLVRGSNTSRTSSIVGLNRDEGQSATFASRAGSSVCPCQPPPGLTSLPLAGGGGGGIGAERAAAVSEAAAKAAVEEAERCDNMQAFVTASTVVAGVLDGDFANGPAGGSLAWDNEPPLQQALRPSLSMSALGMLDTVLPPCEHGSGGSGPTTGVSGQGNGSGESRSDCSSHNQGIFFDHSPLFSLRVYSGAAVEGGGNGMSRKEDVNIDRLFGVHQEHPPSPGLPARVSRLGSYIKSGVESGHQGQGQGTAASGCGGGLQGPGPEAGVGAEAEEATGGGMLFPEQGQGLGAFDFLNWDDGT
ncbi:unnamed protein product [Discosporangium mesarthrocarpum]